MKFYSRFVKISRVGQKISKKCQIFPFFAKKNFTRLRIFSGGRWVKAKHPSPPSPPLESCMVSSVFLRLFLKDLLRETHRLYSITPTLPKKCQLCRLWSIHFRWTFNYPPQRNCCWNITNFFQRNFRTQHRWLAQMVG